HGRVTGRYRQTHIDPGMSSWCTAGDDLPVFETEIGRIGLMLNEDVRFPEASGVLAVRRADLIAICTRWDGSYGGYLHDAGGLFAEQYPVNTMCLWYAIAKTAQAYTIVANPIDDGAQGSSGIFTINPVDSAEPPVVAATDTSGAVSCDLTTLGNPQWWMNQQRLIGGRRADLAVPAMLPTESAAFHTWRSSPGWVTEGWTAYQTSVR
ncbi:MAG: carbon-nitrogen hydrolase family protein, partial [Actinomycetales bacterium]